MHEKIEKGMKRFFTNNLDNDGIGGKKGGKKKPTHIVFSKMKENYM